MFRINVLSATLSESLVQSVNSSESYVRKHSSCFLYETRCIYTVSRKKGATDFFAVTFTYIDGFS